MAGNIFFYNTFTRFEELVAGGMLALLLTLPGWKDRIRTYAAPVFWGSLAVFFLLCAQSFPTVPHPVYENVPLVLGSYTSAAFFSAALIARLVTAPDNAFVSRLFGNGFLATWGKYSYSAYLFHVPVALILQEAFSHAFLKGWRAYAAYVVLTYGLTLLIAFGTWHLIEKHFLNLKRYFEYDRRQATPPPGRE
jgi:peptidoglycan/LPS O-acetylase OafA/YrhL